MLRIKTVLKETKGKGIGLFASEFVAKGTLIWKFDEGLDLLVDPENVPEMFKSYFARIAPLSKVTGKYIVCIDDARFMNHSDSPNIKVVYEDGSEEKDYAKSDIQIGDEVTINYREICENDSKRGLLF